MRGSKEGLNWKTPPYRKGEIMYNTQEFKLIRQHLFWTVLDRLFLFRLLLCLLYQISEHIIVQITFIIILVVSLLPLSRNKTNSHFLNIIFTFKAVINFQGCHLHSQNCHWLLEHSESTLRAVTFTFKAVINF